MKSVLDLYLTMSVILHECLVHVSLIYAVIATILFRTPMFEKKERQLSHSLLKSLTDCHAQCYATSIVKKCNSLYSFHTKLTS